MFISFHSLFDQGHFYSKKVKLFFLTTTTTVQIKLFDFFIIIINILQQTKQQQQPPLLNGIFKWSLVLVITKIFLRRKRNEIWNCRP